MCRAMRGNREELEGEHGGTSSSGTSVLLISQVECRGVLHLPQGAASDPAWLLRSRTQAISSSLFIQ